MKPTMEFLPDASKNLNDLEHIADFGFSPMLNNNTTSGDIEAIFRDVKDRLIQEIANADIIVGCVAWLTCSEILDALAAVKSGVSIIVQKEDMLRPDLGTKRGFENALRKKYESLTGIGCRYHFNKLGKFSVCSDASLDAVRCVGNYNKNKAPAFPRMHNKFIVFCEWAKEVDDPSEYPDRITPKKVWTGSFNFTKNAGYSFENALLISNVKIAEAYFNEYQEIAGLSEPLDWECEWVSPEWRIGT